MISVFLILILYVVNKFNMKYRRQLKIPIPIEIISVSA